MNCATRDALLMSRACKAQHHGIDPVTMPHSQVPTSTVACLAMPGYASKSQS